MSLVFNQKITLDLTISRVQNVHCNQDDDKSRNILITLSDNGKPYTLTNDIKIFLKISKPDNTFIYIDEDDVNHLYRNDDGTISIILSEQATCVPGICEAELQLVSSEKIISTRKFNIVVKKSVVSDKEIESIIETNIIKKFLQHILNYNNPHEVTKEQIGLGNVENLEMNDQTPTYEEAEELENILSGEKISTTFGKIKRAITSLIAHVNNFDNPHKTTKIQIDLGNVDNTSDIDKPVSTAQQKAIDGAYANSNKYTDQKIADLINGAPETLDTLKEVADAIETSKTVEDALNNAIGKKANQAELDTHTNNDTIHITSDERAKWNDANDKKHSHNNKSVLDKITLELMQKWSNGSSLTGVKGETETEYRTGNVNITKTNIGLDKVDNTSDADKPISTATQAALSKKQDSLGFVPVQQGGGINQGTNKIYIGWNGALCCTVDNTNIGAFSFVGHTHDYIPTSASCNKNWNWSGQSGQPSWLWGGEDGTNMYVYNPSNFTVYRCTGGINKGGNGVGINGNATTFRTYDNAGSPVDNVMTLGSSGGRWKQLYAATTSISTSDRNMKDNICKLTDIHKEFFMKLVPVSFTFKDGESGRTHVGFIAQDVEQSMRECGLTDLDFAGLCKDIKVEAYLDEETGEYEEKPLLDNNGNVQYIYSLRYEEFIAIITYVLQDNVNEVKSLKKDIDKIKSEVSSIKAIIEK